jgi:hypothetical protein
MDDCIGIEQLTFASQQIFTAVRICQATQDFPKSEGPQKTQKILLLPSDQSINTISMANQFQQEEVSSQIWLFGQCRKTVSDFLLLLALLL